MQRPKGKGKYCHFRECNQFSWKILYREIRVNHDQICAFELPFYYNVAEFLRKVVNGVEKNNIGG